MTLNTLAALLSAAALTTLTACGGSGGGTGSPDAPGGATSTATVSAAPPGKYQTLPEPCGSVSASTLHALLPSSEDYAGAATLTYDTDRRVGCKWSGLADGANRQLAVDYERVVSYDPSVSDEAKAEQEFEQKASAAHIPDNSPDPHDSVADPGASPSGSPSADPDGDVSPRRVGGIGDEAYLDDTVLTEDDGLHRDVTVVFRIANVLVTVDFSQWSGGKSGDPSDFALQLGAHGLAQELAKNISG